MAKAPFFFYAQTAKIARSPVRVERALGDVPRTVEDPINPLPTASYWASPRQRMAVGHETPRSAERVLLVSAHSARTEPGATLYWLGALDTATMSVRSLGGSTHFHGAASAY